MTYQIITPGEINQNRSRFKDRYIWERYWYYKFKTNTYKVYVSESGLESDQKVVLIRIVLDIHEQALEQEV